MANADIVSAIIPFGAEDIARANEIIDEAGLNDADVADYIKDFARVCDMNILDIDVVAKVYEYILQNVRTIIEEKTQIDILNTEGYEINVAGNYRATSYDSSTENGERVRELIKTFSVRDGMSAELLWFFNQIDF